MQNGNDKEQHTKQTRTTLFYFFSFFLSPVLRKITFACDAIAIQSFPSFAMSTEKEE